MKITLIILFYALLALSPLWGVAFLWGSLLPPGWGDEWYGFPTILTSIVLGLAVYAWCTFKIIDLFTEKKQ